MLPVFDAKKFSTDGFLLFSEPEEDDDGAAPSYDNESGIESSRHRRRRNRYTAQFPLVRSFVDFCRVDRILHAT